MGRLWSQDWIEISMIPERGNMKAGVCDGTEASGTTLLCLDLDGHWAQLSGNPIIIGHGNPKLTSQPLAKLKFLLYGSFVISFSPPLCQIYQIWTNKIHSCHTLFPSNGRTETFPSSCKANLSFRVTCPGTCPMSTETQTRGSENDLFASII